MTKTKNNDVELKLFKYKGYVGKRRKKTKGVLAAVSEQKAIEELDKQSIKEVKLTNKTPMLAKYNYFSGKVKDYELGMFFEKLATQMEVGLSPSRSLQNFLTEGFKYNTLLFIFRVKEELNTGSSVTESMKKPGVLPKDIITLIEIGEETGKIIDIFREVSKLFLEQAKIKKSIKKATYKPIGLIGFSLAILLFIVPIMLTPIKALQQQFQTGGGLPTITKIVMASTDFLTHKWWLIAIILGIIITTHKTIYKNKFSYKEKWDTFTFNIPIIGKFKSALAVYLTLLNLYILQRSGMPVEQSFKMISDSQENEEFKKDIEEIRLSLKEGNSLEESMNYSTYIPKVYKDIIKQGESTGKMVQELEKAKVFAEKDFHETSDLIIASFSKITGFFVTILVGIIIIAVYMPIFSVVGQVMKTM
jgi:type IV pilus assembly protein PilC